MAKSKTPTRSAVSPPENTTPQSIEITAAAQIDIEAAAGEGQTALPRFRMVAYTGSAMRVAGWRHAVILDLAGLNIPSQMRPIRFSHDPASGVGHTDAIRIEQGQLIASGLVSRDTPTAREIVTSSKNGFPWQASVGASVEEFEFIREGQKVLVNGQEFAGPVNVVRKATLGEISFVDLGADGKTSVNVAAIAATQENNMDGDTKDNANGTSAPATNGVVSQAPVESAPATDDASKNGTNANAIEDIRAQALAETSRIAAVRRLCAGQHLDIEAQAIREGWDATRTELEILRANRPKAPAVHVPDQSVSTQILEAACLIAARFEDLEKHCEERALDLAAKRFRGGIGLQELLLEAAWANGYSGRNFRDSRNVLKFAFNPGIEAGLSTIDIGGILSNVANKFLLEGFFSVERTWRNITAVRNVSDFKTVTSYRLIGKDQYEIVAPGGELKHGTLGEEQYTNKADTYGLLLAIDRRDIINDDLGAITTVPRKLGRGSGLKINDVFWSIFMANSDFFKVGNKNFLSGADTVLSIDGLTKAEVAFMDQVDGDGKPLGMLPAILLVPTALSAIGSQLFKSMELRDTTASTKYPVSNPHQGKFRVEVSRYLSNAQYTGNSAKAWYLLADAADLPVIEVAFLNGQESPTIETAEADFNVLGIQMRGYHDFGVNLQDPRGGTKSKGEA
ncbi:MAG: hypothetical protein IT430_01940 [Phycisphaerales bacterium]|nr:hypothetical protein [Phycisphaerales bacterium]